MSTCTLQWRFFEGLKEGFVVAATLVMEQLQEQEEILDFFGLGIVILMFNGS